MAILSSDMSFFEQLLIKELLREDSKRTIKKYIDPYMELMAFYRCAMMEVETKFKVLSEELSLKYDHNPIETVKTRLKSPESILEKMSGRNIPVSVENIEAYINDIAGVRVICSFISDIYMLSESLLKQDDVTLIQEKDYIAEPKPNGYRSLHLIVETPIFLHDRKKMVRVEIQLRTIAMDWWASSEHKIRYKKELPDTMLNEINRDLFECARIGADMDEKMEQIQEKVTGRRNP